MNKKFEFKDIIDCFGDEWLNIDHNTDKGYVIIYTKNYNEKIAMCLHNKGINFQVERLDSKRAYFGWVVRLYAEDYPRFLVGQSI